jgi:hypothetical protein
VTKLLQFKMTEESYAHHPRTAEFEGAVVLITGAASGTDSIDLKLQDELVLLTKLLYRYRPNLRQTICPQWLPEALLDGLISCEIGGDCSIDPQRRQ